MSQTNSEMKGRQSSTGHTFAASDWLDVHFTYMRPEYEEMLRWVGIQPGWHVLDAASGPGSFLPLMTELVGPTGHVDAIDLAPENIQALERRAKEERWVPPVTARVGTILDLPYTDNTFDVVWCANTTQYLSDDELRTMLREFRRVVRPGGLVAIKEYDVTAQQVQPSTPTLMAHLHDALVKKGNAYHRQLLRGIELSPWLRAAGLVDIRQKPTLMVRFQPVSPVERLFIGDFIKYCASVAYIADLPQDELGMWLKMSDLEAPDSFFNNPDYQYRAIQTVFLGTVPA